MIKRGTNSEYYVLMLRESNIHIYIHIHTQHTLAVIVFISSALQISNNIGCCCPQLSYKNNIAQFSMYLQ